MNLKRSVPEEAPQIDTIRDIYSPEECKENDITFEEIKNFQDVQSLPERSDNKYYRKDPL